VKSKQIEMNKMILVGVNFYGDPLSVKGGWDEENEIGKTSQRFMTHKSKETYPVESLKNTYFYEIHIYNDQTEEKGLFEVFVGEEIDELEAPIDLSIKCIPKGQYLCFTLVGEEIVGDFWQKIDDYIEENYHMKRDKSFIIQRYDERFKGMDRLSESALDVLVPLVD